MLSLVLLKYIEMLNQTTLANCKKQCQKLPGPDDFDLLDSPELNETFFVDISYNFSTKNWLWVSEKPC